MFDNTNPYEVFCRYYAAFFNFKGELQEVEIEETVFLAFKQFVKTERNLRRSDERHEEYLEQTEDEVTYKMNKEQKSVEEVICERELEEEVNAAIDTLPDVQRRRLLLYHKYGLTYAQIAEVERCSHPAIIKSVKEGLKKIKKFFLFFIGRRLQLEN